MHDYDVPPILVLLIGDLVRQGILPSNIVNYNERLSFGDSNAVFSLAGATFHRTDHFISALNTETFGWLFYDCLDGCLQKFTPDLVADAVINNIIYVRVVSKYDNKMIYQG